MDILAWFKALWQNEIKEKLGALLALCFNDLRQSDIFELAVDRGRIAAAQLLDSNAPGRRKAEMVEEQIVEELRLQGYKMRTHLVEQARLLAYRSLAKDGTMPVEPDIEPMAVLTQRENPPGTPVDESQKPTTT